MIEVLAAVALMFTGQPVEPHCPRTLAPGVAGLTYTYSWKPPVVFLPRRTCRNLVSARPSHENLDTLTHELIHVRYPRVRHGTQMQRYVRRYLPAVARLLRRFR